LAHEVVASLPSVKIPQTLPEEMPVGNTVTHLDGASVQLWLGSATPVV
jgi:hypothetical protein